MRENILKERGKKAFSEALSSLGNLCVMLEDVAGEIDGREISEESRLIAHELKLRAEEMRMRIGIDLQRIAREIGKEVRAEIENDRRRLAALAVERGLGRKA